MNDAAWVSGVIGLGGAIIGAAAALWGQLVDARRRARDEASRERKLVIEEILVRSSAIDRCGHESILLATNVGSLTGTVTRVVGSVAPVDFVLLFDRMNVEVTALERAAARVWLFADPRTVALANAVTIAAAEVMSAHHVPASGRVWNLARIALIGRHSADVERIQQSRAGLSDAREALIVHTRETLGLPATDPFEVASM